MNRQLANDTLMAILFNYAFVDGFYETCVKAGIAKRPWPPFTGTNLLRRFEAVAKEKTVKAAIYEISEGLEFDHRRHSLPKDIGSLRKIFDSACDYLFSLDLSVKLKQSPESFRTLLQEYNHASHSNQSEVQSIESMIVSFVKENERRIASNEFEVEVPGWPVLSSHIGGFNPGRLTIISAGTGVGKTNLCMNLATSLWKNKIPSLYINMEMDLHDVATRFLTAQLEVERRDLKNQSYIEKISPLQEILGDNSNVLFFTSGRALTLTDIDVMANEHKEKYGIKFLFVDYDQKINQEVSGDEWKLIQKSCESLEETAKRLHIHVVLLAQADEDGSGVPRASKRMLQSASTALFFFKECDNYFLRAIKNRHGKNGFELELKYDPVKSIIREGDLANIQQILNNKKAILHDPANFR